MKYVSIKSAIPDWIDLSGQDSDIPKDTILKWATDVIKRACVPQAFIQKVKVLDFENYKLCLPDDFCRLVQVAHRDKTVKSRPQVQASVKEFKQKVWGTDCEMVITMECPNCTETECTCDQPEVIIDATEMWKRAYPEVQYGHLDWMRGFGGFNRSSHPVSSYDPSFRLLRPSSDYFMSEEVFKNCIHFDRDVMANCRNEFSIQNDYMHFNFEKGDIILSYTAYNVDEEGYIKIPDNQYLIDAISWYIEERMLYVSYRKTKDRNDLLASENAAKKHLYNYNVAVEELNTPDFINWSDFIERKYESKHNRSFKNNQDRSRIREQSFLDRIHR